MLALFLCVVFCCIAQDVIEDAEEVSSTYTFELCTLFIYSEGVRSCYEITTTEVNVAPMIPLFYYKYEVTVLSWLFLTHAFVLFSLFPSYIVFSPAFSYHMTCSALRKY